MKLPAEILSQHIIALGKTGSGKSSAMRVLVEGLLDDDKPVCIIDPKGDHWGIKLSADGKHAGYPVVIFGGEHADVPLNEHAGPQVAEVIATGNRPCIIDLGGWMVGERTRFFIGFASALFKHSKGLRWLVIDEVHNFCPQGKIHDVDAGKMLHWSNRLASEGRGRGINLIAASQRPQKVHKDFVTSCETLIAMRVIHPLDRGAIKDWIDGCEEPGKGNEVLGSLASMKRGEAWVWSPEAGFGPERVKFPLFKTYDSFKPQAGESTKLTGWAAVDLSDVKSKLAKVVEEAKANDPKELRRENAELRRALKSKGAAAVAVADPKAIERAIAQRDKYWWRMHATVRKMAEGHVQTVQRAIKLLEAVKLNGEAAPVVMAHEPTPIPERAKQRQIIPKTMRQSDSIGKGEIRILSAIAQHAAGVTREQLTVLTGYKRSSRDTYLQRLRAAELINDGETITATDDGIAALGPDFDPLPTGDALREHWMQRLPEGERKILAVVLDKYPEAVERDALSDATGYQRSSRDTYLQRLRSRRLVETTREGVRASEELFT